MEMYVYNGMPEAEQAKWLASMRKNIDVPHTKDFRIRDKDKGAVLLHKQRKQEEYRAMREAELQDELQQHTRFRTVCGITFTKGEPLDVTAQLGEDGNPLELNEEEMGKLRSLAGLGVLSRIVPDEEIAEDAQVGSDQGGGAGQPPRRRGRPPKNRDAQE